VKPRFPRHWLLDRVPALPTAGYALERVRQAEAFCAAVEEKAKQQMQQTQRGDQSP
jgi:hypothetical protein